MLLRWCGCYFYVLVLTWYCAMGDFIVVYWCLMCSINTAANQSNHLTLFYRLLRELWSNN